MNDIKNNKDRYKTKGLNTNLPLVSIITPSFNSVRFLEKTILSVIQQDYPNIEYIIIDGGSTDGTIDIIKKYEDHIDYWISEPDEGIYQAMHKGISFANGEIIGNINSDDYYEPEILASVVDIFKNNQAVSIVHGGINIIDMDGNFLKYMDGDHHKLHKSMSIRHPSVFLKRETYFEVGGYNFSFRIGADRELMLRIYREKYKFFNIEKPIANFRQGGISDGITLSKMKEALRLYKKYKLSIFRYFLVYILKPTIVTLFFSKNTYHNSFRKE